MNEMSKKAIEDGASDIHITVAREVMRVTGTIRDYIVDPERMDEMLDLIHAGKE